MAICITPDYAQGRCKRKSSADAKYHVHGLRPARRAAGVNKVRPAPREGPAAERTRPGRRGSNRCAILEFISVF